MLSPYGRKAREKREQENPQPIVFSAPKAVNPADMAVKIGGTSQSTQATTVTPAPVQKETLQQRINKIAKPDAPMSKIPTKPSTQEIIARGGSITAGTPDPSEPVGRKIPFVGKVLFGRGYNKLYTPDTMAGGFEKSGVVGFFTEGFTDMVNPTREKLGERIYERYSRLVESGTDEQEAIDKAVTDTINRTLPTFTGQKRAVDELAKKPGSELTEDEEASLFWMNQREKLFAVLDAPVFVGSTKAVKAAGETVTPLVRDQILERLAKPGAKQDELANRQVQSYVDFLQKKEDPTVSELYRGVELLRSTGRQYDDLSDDLAKRTRESLFGRTEEPETLAKTAPEAQVDAKLKTRVEVPMRDVSGARFVVPANTVLEPKISGNKATFTLNDVEYTVPKNQYDNLKGQSVREVATPFAPELADTTETVRGVVTGDPKAKALKTIEDNGYVIEEDMIENYITKDDEIVDYDELPDEVRQAVDVYFGDAETKYEVDTGLATKYSKYTLPGGDNYREILVQAPVNYDAPLPSYAKAVQEEDGQWVIEVDGIGKASDPLPSKEEAIFAYNKATMSPDSGAYKSSHWEEPNVLFHVRANERVVDGERHFFMEELQSDWAKDGRVKGFDQGISTEEAKALLPDGWKVVGNGDTYTVVDADGKAVPSLLDGDGPGEKAYGGNERAALGRALGEDRLMGNFKPGVPQNPLLNNWQVLGIKRALIEAEKSGAQRFTWVNGAQTRERYKLSKEVDNISWGDSTRGDLIGNKSVSVKTKSGVQMNFAIDPNGKVIESFSQAQGFVGKTLDDVLGKGLADRIMSASDGSIADEGLNIGGEWANNLYDRQVRDIVKKLTGAEIEEVDLRLGLGEKKPQYTLSGNHRDVGAFANQNNVKEGDTIADEAGNEFVVVTKADGISSTLVVSKNVYETGLKPILAGEDNLSWTIIVGNKETTFGKGVFATLDDAMESAKRIGKEAIHDGKKEVELIRDLSAMQQKQMSIKLTPEVIAKIKSQAPEVTLENNDARAYAGVPLIFGAFDTQTAEAAVEGATGLPEGIEENEEGDIVVDPKKAFLGMAAAGIIGRNFSREKGRLSSKQVAPDGASSRPGQRELPGEMHLPEKGQTRYPMASSQFSDSLAKSYLENGGKTIDEATEGLQPGVISPEKNGQFSEFRKAIDEAWVSTVEAVQDNLYRVRRLVQDPKVKVTDDTDPYLAELLFHGRVGARLEEARDIFIGIDKDIITTAKNVGVPEADMTLLVNKYLHARHAPERNARLGDGASGLTDDDAISIMGDIESLPYAAEVKRIANSVADMNYRTLEVLKDAQVIGEDAYNSMRTAYANHVPLQRVLKDDEDVVQSLSGRGFDVKSTGIKRAKGSDRQVADILANVVTNYEQAIIRSEKNRVDLATLQFARDNQNLGIFTEIKPKAIGVKFGSDSLVKKVEPGRSDEDIMGEAYDLYAKSGFFLREDSMDVAQLADNVDQMELLVSFKKEALDSNPASKLGQYVARRGEFKGELPEALGSQGRYTGRFSRGGDDIVTELGFADSETARQAWNDYVVQKQEYEELAADFRKAKKSLTEITRADKKNAQEVRAAYKKEIAELNKMAQEKYGTRSGDRFVYEQINDPRVLTLRENGKPVHLLVADEKLAVALKGVNRQYLPAFTKFVGAFTRFYSGLQTRFNPEFAFPNKIRDLQEAVVYAGSRGELGFKGGVRGALDQRAYLDVLDGIRGVDSEGAKLYKQMIEDGGTTGGMSLSTREQVELDIAEIRKMNRSNPRKAAKKLVETIDNFNTVFEDSTRLSLYKEALRRGVSRKRAAEIAKEASVNFNKFGTGGPILNALWMFSNASIQGTTKMIRAMKNPKVAALVTSSVGSAVWATGEWNDRLDPQWREKVTAWDRTNSLVVVLPPNAESDKFGYISIPVGWGIKPIKVSMDYAYDAITGHSKSITEVMNGIGAATVNAYNPLGGTDMFSAITPTILDLPSEIARNKAWHGGKIMPDWDQNAPDSIRYFSSLADNTTGQMVIQASEGLSGLGIEVSPASMYYAYQGYVGGAGRTATDFVNTMITLGRGELPEQKDVPVWSRFVKVRDNEEIGAASEEYEAIKERLSEQSRERFYLKQEAENSYRQLASLPKEEAAVIFEDIAETDPDLAKEIADVIAEEQLGVTYTQRLVKQLGVANGERAEFIFEKINQLESNEEKAALWEEYVQKKIITAEVAEQLSVLVKQQKDLEEYKARTTP